jgi:ketol-acid reductoisomerase
MVLDGIDPVLAKRETKVTLECTVTSVVKAQLAQSKDNLSDAAYLRGVHLEPRIKMMQVWADTLNSSSKACHRQLW